MANETTQDMKLKGRVIPFEQNGDYFYNKGLTAYQQRNLKKAKLFFEKAASLSPKEPSYLSQLALTLSELQEFEASNKWLYKLVNEVDPTEVECHFFMANNFAHLGLYYEAKEAASRYISLDPDGAFCEEAEELLELLLEEFELGNDEVKEEEQLVVQHENARKLIEQGDYQEAIQSLHQLVNEHPTFWPAYNNLALAYYYENEFEQAFGILDDLLDKDPGNLHGLCNLAIMYDYVGLMKRCKEILNRLKNIKPILPEHRFKLGTTFGVLGYHDDAYQWFSSIKKHGMNWGATYYHWLAVSAFLSNQLLAATRAWKKILEIDPDGEVAPYFLKKLEKGTLERSEVDYHYRIEKPSTKLNYEKLDSKRRNQLAHLYILYSTNRSEEAVDILETVCQNANESLLIKELVANLLLKVQKEVTITEGQDRITFDEPITWVEKGFEIIRLVIDYLEGNGLDVDIVVFDIWYAILEAARTNDKKYVQNTNAWAAALTFLYFELKQQKITRKKLANDFQISTTTLGKYMKELMNQRS